MIGPPIDGLRRVEAADVLLDGRAVATLRRTSAGVAFVYTPAHVAAGGRPVATTLPVTDEELVLAAGALPPFFAGLLPEGRRLAAIRTAAKTSVDDELTLLLAVGGDTIGDVQVVPAGTVPDPDDGAELGDPAEVSFAQMFARATGADPDLLDRTAIPGVQDKLSGRMIALPVSGPRGGLLLKLDPPEFPHLVANEAFFLRAARRSGLATADVRVVTDRDGRAGLLVTRFDRQATDGDGLARLAQEDACQVLARYPADRYRVTAEDVVTGLARVTSAPVVAAWELLRQIAFAYLTGNGDAHAKNFSVYRPDGEWRVAPAYDVPSTHPYGDTTMALSVAGRDREDITWRTVVELGANVGVREPAVRDLLADLTARVDGWIDDLDELPFDARRIHGLRRLVVERRARLTSE